MRSRGTAFDALLADLERFARLRYVEAGDTHITAAALHRFRAGRPGLNFWRDTS